jgi:selenocysteine-specific elongation factor
VFTIIGAGTVVTGTLTGGSLTVDEDVVIARSGHSARVRSIESAHREADRAGPGARVALNLAGTDHHTIVRGDAIVRAGEWTTATTVDVAVQPLVSEPLTGRSRLHAYVGSGEHEVRLRPIGSDGNFARLRFDRPLSLAPGDRVVLRDPGPGVTVGGATVLDVDPATPIGDAARVLALDLGPRLVAGHGWISRADLPRVSGLGRADADTLATSTVDAGHAVAIGAWLVAPAVLADLRARAGARVAARRRERPLAAGIEIGALAAELGVDAGRLRGALLDQPEFVVEQGTVRDARSAARITDSDAGRALVDELSANPLSPAPPSDAVLARTLVREGALVDVDGIVFTTDAVDRARALVAAAVVERGTLTSRKYVVPLLTRFDAEGITRRRGDARVPGPRALAGRAESRAADEPD